MYARKRGGSGERYSPLSSVVQRRLDLLEERRWPEGVEDAARHFVARSQIPPTDSDWLEFVEDIANFFALIDRASGPRLRSCPCRAECDDSSGSGSI